MILTLLNFRRAMVVYDRPDSYSWEYFSEKLDLPRSDAEALVRLIRGVWA